MPSLLALCPPDAPHRPDLEKAHALYQRLQYRHLYQCRQESPRGVALPVTPTQHQNQTVAAVDGDDSATGSTDSKLEQGGASDVNLKIGVKWGFSSATTNPLDRIVCYKDNPLTGQPELKPLRECHLSAISLCVRTRNASLAPQAMNARGVDLAWHVARNNQTTCMLKMTTCRGF